MLRWGFGKKDSQKGNASDAADEWSYLRSQPDHDAGEMASVRSRKEAPASAPVAPTHGSAPPEAPGALTRRRGAAGAEPFPDSEAVPVASAAELALQISLGPLSHTQLIDGELLIGRRDIDRGAFPQVELADDDAVSRRHAAIRVRNGCYLLRDLNSLNGTFLNGRQLRAGQEVPLHTGDRIEMGEFTLLRVIPAPAAERAPQPVELTAEDQALGDMLRDALGTAPPTAEAANRPLEQTGAPVDVLELALQGGQADGLLSSHGLTGTER